MYLSVCLCAGLYFLNKEAAFVFGILIIAHCESPFISSQLKLANEELGLALS